MKLHPILPYTMSLQKKEILKGTVPRVLKPPDFYLALPIGSGNHVDLKSTAFKNIRESFNET